MSKDFFERAHDEYLRQQESQQKEWNHERLVLQSRIGELEKRIQDYEQRQVSLKSSQGALLSELSKFDKSESIRNTNLLLVRFLITNSKT